MAEITKRNIKDFRKLYDNAVKENKESFMFDNQEVLTTYAKYVLKYIDKTINKTLGVN